jgi:hypothetical protein
VPIASILRDPLVDQLRRRSGSALLFGSTDTSPFDPSGLTTRADKAWTAAGLARITLEEQLGNEAEKALV